MTGTETIEPALTTTPANQPRRGRRRAAQAALVMFLSIVFAVVAMAGPADAAVNRGGSAALGSTGCTVTIGGWLNTKHYPATASHVTCSGQHTVQVRNQLWYAGTNGQAALFGQSGFYTYTGYGTPELDSYWSSCPGYWDWQSSAQVYVDGVYYGDFGNAWGWWTACT